MQIFISDELLEPTTACSIGVALEQRHPGVQILRPTEYYDGDAHPDRMCTAIASSYCFILAIDSTWKSRCGIEPSGSNLPTEQLAVEGLLFAHANRIPIILVLCGDVRSPERDPPPADLAFLSECEWIPFNPQVPLSWGSDGSWDSVWNWFSQLALADAVLGRLLTIDKDTDRIALRPQAKLSTKSTRAFISHSSVDRSWVELNIVAPLGQAGIVPWYSKVSIESARHWEREILAGLTSCEWFILVVSPRAAASEWVKDELNWAFENRSGRIVPVIMELCDPWSFHIRLARIQAVDCTGDPSVGFASLLNTLR